MNTNLLLTFIALNIVNVILQTVKSIATVKCGKVAARSSMLLLLVFIPS